MPTAPLLPPDQLGPTQGNAGINPTNFLMAAADLHQQGALSSPVPAGVDPLAKAGKGPGRKAKIKLIK